MGLSGGGDSLWDGKAGDLGVGWEESGPLPGVGGRGVSGGLSRGAGIEVPSVREKLMGVSVNGLYSNLLDDMVRMRMMVVVVEGSKRGEAGE